MAAAIVTFAYVGLPRLMRSMQVCKAIGRALKRKPRVSPCTIRAGEWTIAASRGVFAESLRAIRGSHSIVLVVGLSMTAAMSVLLL
eukprot:scaffold548993_cov51-Prasinocladus_malaysianus.AAC.1